MNTPDPKLAEWLQDKPSADVIGVVSQDGATAALLHAAADLNDPGIDAAIAAAARAGEPTLTVLIDRHAGTDNDTSKPIVDAAITHRNLPSATRTKYLRGVLSQQTHSWVSVAGAGRIPRSMRDEFLYHPDTHVAAAMLTTPGVATEADCWTFTRHTDPTNKALAVRALLGDLNKARHVERLWESGDETVRAAVVDNLDEITAFGPGGDAPRDLTRTEERQAQWLLREATTTELAREGHVDSIIERIAWLHPNGRLATSAVEILVTERGAWANRLWERTTVGTDNDTLVRERIVSSLRHVAEPELDLIAQRDTGDGVLGAAAEKEATRRVTADAEQAHAKLLKEALAVESAQRKLGLAQRLRGDTPRLDAARRILKPPAVLDPWRNARSGPTARRRATAETPTVAAETAPATTGPPAGEPPAGTGQHPTSPARPSVDSAADPATSLSGAEDAPWGVAHRPAGESPTPETLEQSAAPEDVPVGGLAP